MTRLDRGGGMKKDKDLERFMARQRMRVREMLNEREGRLAERLQAMGQDRKGRLALTLTGDYSGFESRRGHATGKRKVRDDGA